MIWVLWSHKKVTATWKVPPLWLVFEFTGALNLDSIWVKQCCISPSLLVSHAKLWQWEASEKPLKVFDLYLLNNVLFSCKACNHFSDIDYLESYLPSTFLTTPPSQKETQLMDLWCNFLIFCTSKRAGAKTTSPIVGLIAYTKERMNVPFLKDSSGSCTGSLLTCRVPQ